MCHMSSTNISSWKAKFPSQQDSWRHGAYWQHLRVMPSACMTDVSLFLCCWFSILCFVKGTCSIFARWIPPSYSRAPVTSLCCPKQNLCNQPPPVKHASAAGTFTASSTVELPHISFCSTVSWIAPWSEEGGHPPRQHSSTSAMRSKNALLQVSKIASWRLSCMGTLHFGRLRRPSSGREARSSGHSPRASGAGGEACVHRDCNPQVWTTEGMKASFANVGFTNSSERWMKWGRPRARLPLPDSSRSAADGVIGLPVTSQLLPNSS